MKDFAHQVFFWFLFFIASVTIVAIGFRNFDFYTLSFEERPFHERYDELKPSGIESHGYGIIGSCMIIFGVSMYSSRKRIRAFKNFGSIKYFLEFHIFLCLLGPVLVLYHTTFKFGGIVAVSFWSMTAVALSGIVGRYLYVQIPKGIKGDELTVKELEEKSIELYRELIEDFELDPVDLRKIDALASPKRTKSVSIVSLLTFFILNDLTRRGRLKSIVQHLHGKSVDTASIKKIIAVANERIKLLRRVHFLEQVKNLFHYWHVVHLPFSIIMFVILFIHVGVAITFGYTWIY
ncbi:MAG: hypothetical protein Q8L88_09180 [Bacteroidota bacterium]|nr:hypothetical protein [Bacteroidota bacterium]